MSKSQVLEFVAVRKKLCELFALHRFEDEYNVPSEFNKFENPQWALECHLLDQFLEEGIASERLHLIAVLLKVPLSDSVD